MGPWRKDRFTWTEAIVLGILLGCLAGAIDAFF